MVHNVAQPDLEAIMEYLLDAEVNVDYRLGWTWISHEEVSTVMELVLDRYARKRSLVICAEDGLSFGQTTMAGRSDGSTIIV